MIEGRWSVVYYAPGRAWVRLRHHTLDVGRHAPDRGTIARWAQENYLRFVDHSGEGTGTGERARVGAAPAARRGP